LLAALADVDVGLSIDRWITLESVAARLAVRYPTLLGASIIAATARLEVDDGAGDDEEVRAKGLRDVIALELAGPFAWFGLTEIVDVPGKPRAVRLTAKGSALAAGEPLAGDGNGDKVPAMAVDASGEITLRVPSPGRVWALTAFAEPVDLGPESHYRLTQSSLTAALAGGVDLEQIVVYLQRSSGEPLPSALAGKLAAWARSVKRVRVERGFLLRVDAAEEAAALCRALRESGWDVEQRGDRGLLVTRADGATSPAADDQLWIALRAAGFAPFLARSAEAFSVSGRNGPAPAE
jgi:hypothetical protein